VIRIRKILKSLLLLGIIGLVAFSVTNAFFSDTETSKDNLFQAGEFDLGIDNHSYYNGVLNPETTWRVDYNIEDAPPRQFFNFLDLKPGDWGEDTISFHVQNEAWLCADVKLTSDDDNGINEPEGLDGDTTGGVGEGELADVVKFYWWADDGDNVFEICERTDDPELEVVDCQNEVLLPAGPLGNLKVGESATIALADSQANIWGGTNGLPADEVKFVGKAWCFGDTKFEPYIQDGGNQQSGPDDRPVTCDGSQLDNQTQTDGFTLDIAFRAVQKRHNEGFLCNPPEVTVTPRPTEVACIPGYATGVASSAQGLRKNGTAVLLDRSDPTDALGAPQSTGTPSDTPVVAGSFFSLGFGTGNVGGGNIVLTFANPIVDLAGFDFRVFEVTGGTYPDEKIKVEASQNGVNFFDVTPIATRDQFMDLGTSGLAWASHLRITDQSDKSLFELTADAYDLDGVQTFCGTVPFD